MAYSIGMGELVCQYGTGLKSHGTVTNWCTGREWPVNCMTVISARWRSNMPFQRRRKCIFRWPVMGRDRVGVELLYNSGHTKFNPSETRCGRESQHPAEGALRPPTNQFGDQTSWGSDELEIRCGRENQHPERLGPHPPQLSSPGERERNAIMTNRVGSICCSSVRSPTPSHTQPFQIKWEVYFSKNCVARLYCVVVMILHAYAYVFV